MFLRGDISILVPDLFRPIVAILTAPDVSYLQPIIKITRSFSTLKSSPFGGIQGNNGIIFCLKNDIKGTAARYFRPLFFFSSIKTTLVPVP